MYDLLHGATSMQSTRHLRTYQVQKTTIGTKESVSLPSALCSALGKTEGIYFVLLDLVVLLRIQHVLVFDFDSHSSSMTFSTKASLTLS